MIVIAIYQQLIDFITAIILPRGFSQIAIGEEESSKFSVALDGKLKAGDLAVTWHLLIIAGDLKTRPLKIVDPCD